jgi:hypothetical protein
MTTKPKLIRESDLSADKGSPRPWKIHPTGSNLGIKDATGKFVIRKTVNMLTIPEYDRLRADFDLIIKTVNAATGDYVDNAVQTEALDCPVCGQARSFTIDPTNPAAGYCVAENAIHTIKAITVTCAFCKKDTLKVMAQHCDSCGVDYCRRGSDDDRFCVIAHENMHEDREVVN